MRQNKTLTKIWKDIQLNIWNYVYVKIHRLDQFLLKLRDKF